MSILELLQFYCAAEQTFPFAGQIFLPKAVCRFLQTLAQKRGKRNQIANVNSYVFSENVSVSAIWFQMVSLSPNLLLQVQKLCLVWRCLRNTLPLCIGPSSWCLMQTFLGKCEPDVPQSWLVNFCPGFLPWASASQLESCKAAKGPSG